MDSGCVNFLRALWTLAAAERTKPISERLFGYPKLSEEIPENLLGEFVNQRASEASNTIDKVRP